MRKALSIVGIALVVLSLATLAGCDWLKGLLGIPIEVGVIAWDKDPTEWRANGGSIYVVTLPAGGATYEIWGTDIYTDDSPIGTAAIHAGLIPDTATGGTVAIRILPGQASYTGSLRNGITSSDYAAWDGSFEFVTEL